MKNADFTREWIERRVLAGAGLGPMSAMSIGDAPKADFDPGPGAPATSPPKGRRAAVLVPLVRRKDELTILLTRRADHLRHHAGQISFPGGRLEKSDAGLVDCALREAKEEVGIDRALVDVIGELDERLTATGFVVTPVVALVEPTVTVTPQTEEVAEAFETPLSFILNPANHRKVTRVVKGAARPFYAIPYRSHYIWGATAAILVNLYRVLSARPRTAPVQRVWRSPYPKSMTEP